MLTIWRSYTYNILLSISGLTKQLIICGELKMYKEKSASYLPNRLIFFRKIILLQQKYLRTIGEPAQWNLKHLANFTLLISQYQSQFIKVWAGFLQVHNMLQIWNLF